ncbi:MAG: bifunctional demethylmenaquinone methyltransferase/2-methoxy-6-polyprenyl-1,4-benzoquinol methylase UbiE [Thermoguttaceae bacterium]
MLDKSPERIRRFFDHIAPRYDLVNHLLSVGLDVFWRRYAVKTVYNRLKSGIPEGPLLDVCCGTGDFVLAFYHEYLRRKRSLRNHSDDDSGKRLDEMFYGIDFSPQMLEKGEKKVQRNQAQKHVILKEGDALQLPFEENRFSIVSVAFGLRNVADIEQGIREMVRVCQPGGHVVILDFGMPKMPLFSSLYSFYFTKVLPRLGRLISRNQEGAYHYFAESVQQFDRQDQLSRRLEKAGLIEIESQNITFGTVVLHLGKKPESTNSVDLN